MREVYLDNGEEEIIEEYWEIEMVKRIEPIVEGYGKMEENNTFNGRFWTCWIIIF
jgi:hypothetical protein